MCRIYKAVAIGYARTHMHTRTHAHTHTRTHAHTHARRHPHTHTLTQAHTHAHYIIIIDPLLNLSKYIYKLVFSTFPYIYVTYHVTNSNYCLKLHIQLYKFVCCYEGILLSSSVFDVFSCALDVTDVTNTTVR